MTKDSIRDYSATPSSNTDIAGINIQGTAQVSNFDNALKTLMAHLTLLNTVAPDIVANTMLVDNAAGDARETKTFAEVRDLLDTGVIVATRTALKALDTTNDTAAFLTETGRAGWFKWTTGDYSTQIAADTAESIFIKADDTPATSGAWVRVDPISTHIVTIANSAVGTITPPRSGGIAIIVTAADTVTPANAYYGIVYYDVGSSRFFEKCFGGASLAVSTASLTGSTGSPGDVTVGGSSGFQIENRSGFSYTIRVQFL